MISFVLKLWPVSGFIVTSGGWAAVNFFPVFLLAVFPIALFCRWKMPDAIANDPSNGDRDFLLSFTTASFPLIAGNRFVWNQNGVAIFNYPFPLSSLNGRTSFFLLRFHVFS